MNVQGNFQGNVQGNFQGNFQQYRNSISQKSPRTHSITAKVQSAEVKSSNYNFQRGSTQRTPTFWPIVDNAVAKSSKRAAFPRSV